MKKSDVSDYRFVLRKAMVDWEFINDGSWYVSRGVIKLQEGVVLANIISRHYDGDGVNSPSYRICSTSIEFIYNGILYKRVWRKEFSMRFVFTLAKRFVKDVLSGSFNEESK